MAAMSEGPMIPHARYDMGKNRRMCTPCSVWGNPAGMRMLAAQPAENQYSPLYTRLLLYQACLPTTRFGLPRSRSVSGGFSPDRAHVYCMPTSVGSAVSGRRW